MVVIDYIHLMCAENNDEIKNRKEEVRYIYAFKRDELPVTIKNVRLPNLIGSLTFSSY